jgi:hypothetical protein
MNYLEVGGRGTGKTAVVNGRLEMNCKILFFIWLGLIVFFSVVPHGAGDQSFLSKMALTKSGFFQHVFGYFVLGALACLAFEKTLWLYLVGIVFVGVLLEAVQYALPYRTFNPYDIVGNCLGVEISFLGLGKKSIGRIRAQICNRFSRFVEKPDQKYLKK